MGAATTIVCCVEAGRLEAQTVLMAASLRAFGGALAPSRVLAVVGRHGPPLLPATVRALDALGVEIHRAPRAGIGYEWMGYSNKVRAIAHAQAVATSGQVVWLDSDILIVGDLSDLLLPDGIDVAVRQEPVMPSVTAADRGNEDYWRSLAGIVGADYASIPWLDDGRGERLAYFNSGVIVWRRASTFAARYAEAFDRLLRSRLAQRDGSFFAADQVIIAPVIAREGFAWRQLPLRSHRMVFPALLQSDQQSWQGSALLHYSGSLDGDLRPIFERRLRAELPRAADWLAAQRPPEGDHGAPARALATVLKTWRHLRWRRYAARVRKAA